MKPNPTRSALLVIDMENGFIRLKLAANTVVKTLAKSSSIIHLNPIVRIIAKHIGIIIKQTISHHDSFSVFAFLNTFI